MKVPLRKSLEIGQINSSNFSTNNSLQDAAPGDSGAPLYTLGDNSTSGEISDRYLLGIHSGGAGFAAILLQRGNVFFPSWWVKVSEIHYFVSLQ